VKDETGKKLDKTSGEGIVSYNKAKDYILVDRTIKEGKFDFFIQGTINENMTVLYPVNLDMRLYYNPAPMFEPPEEETEVREPMYLFIELDELDIREGRVEVKHIDSPKVIDNEGDSFYFEFSGLEDCPAISCYGSGAEDPDIIDHFRCSVREKLITRACNGTWDIVANLLDESTDPHLENLETLTIEINFIYEGRDDQANTATFSGVDLSN